MTRANIYGAEECTTRRHLSKILVKLFVDNHYLPNDFYISGVRVLSPNEVGSGGFADVFKGVYSIFDRNLTTGKTETLVDAAPGGASRPELSRDQRTLAFVRRVRDKQALVLK